MGIKVGKPTVEPRGCARNFFPGCIIHTKILSFKNDQYFADLHIATIGPRVSWLGGEKVESLLPLATLGFGVAQNREKVSLEVEVLR